MTTPNQDLKQECKECHLSKDISEFRRSGKEYIRSTCKNCETLIARNRAHNKRVKNPEADTIWYRDKIASMSPEELEAFRKEKREQGSRYHREYKQKVFDAYGWKCKCCGEETKEFLTIDHIDKSAAEYRREGLHLGGDAVYRWLIENKFPSGFQTLCMNCQWGRRRNNGICPHQVRRNDQSKDVGSSESKPPAPQVGDEMICSALKDAAV